MSSIGKIHQGLKLGELTLSECWDDMVLAWDQLIGLLCGAAVDESAADVWTGDNYVAFVNRHGQIATKLPEVNGFLLLQALLLRTLGQPISLELQTAITGFGGPEGLFGFWNEELMVKGRPYFRGRRRVRIYPDIDDTGWGIKLLGQYASLDHLRPFLSKDSLPEGFAQIAEQARVDRRLILRTWANADWHKWDCDLCCISNLISSIPVSAGGQLQAVFAENQRLVNAAIHAGCQNLMMYYEPKIFGVFLLLFYDHAFRPFLDDQARHQLQQELHEGHQSLLDQALSSRWAGDDRITYLHGLNLRYYNTTIPALCARYTVTRLAEK